MFEIRYGRVNLWWIRKSESPYWGMGVLMLPHFIFTGPTLSKYWTMLTSQLEYLTG
jgi:hypothetical protein